MSLFLENAARIFETARSAPEAGTSGLTILIGCDGGIQVLSETGLPLDSLRAAQGAAAVYRVTRDGTGVRLEGRSARQKCVLESQGPSRTPRLPPDRPRYSLSGPPLRLLPA